MTSLVSRVRPGTARRPNDTLPGSARVWVLAEANASMRPEPMTVADTGPEPSLLRIFWTPWFMIAALTSAGDQPGCSATSNAATPATCGEAIDVPSKLTLPVPVPASAESIPNPGAEMSGLSALLVRLGPSDVKSVIRSAKPGAASRWRAGWRSSKPC